jgi:drug/metabolite transporter superfamily protein YnfA
VAVPVQLAGVAVLAVQHYGTLLGVAPGSAAAWALPAAYGAVAAVGLIWGVILKISRPDIYETIGLGAHAVSHQASSDLGGHT